MDKSLYACGSCQHKLCAGRVSLFTSLDNEQLLQVMKLIIHKEYKKGEILLFEGEIRNDLVIVNKGQVKAFRNTVDGKEQILYIFSEGDFFGEKNLLRDQA
ncbi:MAG: cyclic nucleotide-binding domain-containing protein, partial [Clostridiaceae bacterium]|nr:cyclic nucleotide-binding domain-containing protein [Clostridiaceae bacterium]